MSLRYDGRFANGICNDTAVFQLVGCMDIFGLDCEFAPLSVQGCFVHNGRAIQQQTLPNRIAVPGGRKAAKLELHDLRSGDWRTCEVRR